MRGTVMAKKPQQDKFLSEMNAALFTPLLPAPGMLEKFLANFFTSYGESFS